MSHPTAARIRPDSRAIAYGAAGLAAAIYLGSFATSYFGQSALAVYMQIPAQVQGIVPAVIDLALVLFTAATLIRRSRGESTVLTNLAVAFWTLVSVISNIAHVLIPAGVPETWGAGVYAGAALSALMPVASLTASLMLESVLIESPARTQPEVLAATAPVREPVTAAPSRATPMVALTPQKPASQTVVTRPADVQAAPPKEQPAGASESPWKDLSRPEQAVAVQALKAEGFSQPAIATELGVSLSTVKRVLAEAQLQAA